MVRGAWRMATRVGPTPLGCLRPGPFVVMLADDSSLPESAGGAAGLAVLRCGPGGVGVPAVEHLTGDVWERAETLYANLLIRAMRDKKETENKCRCYGNRALGIAWGTRRNTRLSRQLPARIAAHGKNSSTHARPISSVSTSN
ncbi:hypothetical protein NDU88_004629 [Pleurodeles waltl]|uniref:Uncharacterized protein n=1 Tax=Pleurodeles waltl TaxID=8319 RepID=A0AAV7MU04_PLEWA|nr:hypothetical protein NDU88_004629 [Pleurodeles waltl]